MGLFMMFGRLGWSNLNIFLSNDERVHPYQRGRAPITGWRLQLREIIETERLVGDVMTRIVRLHFVGLS
jgi:hypothetical protein